MMQERFRTMAGLAVWIGGCALLGATAWSTPPAKADPAMAITVRQEWYRGVYGSNVGLIGVSTADLDGDLKAEVVVGATDGNDYWYVLKKDTTSGYRQAYISPPYAAGLGSILTKDINGDGRPEIIVGTGRDIVAYSGTDYTLLSTVNTTAASGNSIWNLKVADVDRDGELEYVFTDGKDLFVYGVQTAVLKYKLVGYGGNGSTQKYGIAIGNVDGAADIEIVTSNASSGVVVTCIPIDPLVDPLATYPQTPVIKWTNPLGFGIYTCTGDIDSDGKAEIVAGYSNGSIEAFDADLQADKFIIAGTGLQALALADANNDGKLEILRGGFFEVGVYDTTTHALKFSISNPLTGVTNVAAGDLDGDGHTELVWGCGNATTDRDALAVGNTVTPGIKWLSDSVEGPFYAMDFGDVDNDGHGELLYGSTSSQGGKSDGLLFIHDAATKALEWTSPAPTGVDWGGMYRIRHANVDADAKQEIFFTTSMGYTGVLLCYNGSNKLEKWRYLAPDGLTFASLQIADVDGDGQLEVVAGTRKRTTGAPGASFYVLSAANGAYKWSSPVLGSNLSMLRIADVDGDTHPEIVVGDYNGGFYIYDALTKSEKAKATSVNATALETSDINGDNVAEILLGRSTGAIELRNGTTAAFSSTVGTYGGQIDGLAALDLTKDGRPEYIFAVNNKLLVADGANPATLAYQSGVIGNAVGQQDSILAGDFDGDGRSEIMVDLGAAGIQVYEVSAGTGACCVITEMGYGTCQVVSHDECLLLGGTYAGSGIECGANNDVCDFCPGDPNKKAAGACGCNALDTDTDSDGIADCLDECPFDPNKQFPGVCGCNVPDVDSDSDGVLDCLDLCPLDAQKVVPGICGCGILDADSDSDGLLDCNDGCPLDAQKTAPGVCGCGVADVDRDGDKVPDCVDNCPDDPIKKSPGVCGCGIPDTDSDHDGIPDCIDNCPAAPDIDTDHDGVLNCDDGCPNDPGKTEPGQCGCGMADLDNDSDGTANCNDGCPEDIAKTAPGQCGCGKPDTDSDSDGTADCVDSCPHDGKKSSPGVCGCGVPDTDSDADGVVDCKDLCPNDPQKTAPGACGCGKADVDSDGDGKVDCQDSCPQDPGKVVPGVCGCGIPDTDSDHDGTPDCGDFCPQDPRKTAPGACGCGKADTDTDGDGTPDCKDSCPNDAHKTAPGVCGCDKLDTDTDSDGVADCIDNCPNKANPDQADSNHDGVGDACTTTNEPSGQNQPNTNTGDTGTNSGQSDNNSSLQVPNCGTGTAQAMLASLGGLWLISSRSRRRK